MPYISKERRKVLAPLRPIISEIPQDPGEFNYIITQWMVDILNNTKYSYDVYNRLIGALECAKLELYRRMVAPYEDKKIEENGDVYEEAPSV